MADTTTQPVAKRDDKDQKAAVPTRHPLNTLRHEVDRLFDEFDRGFWSTPFRRSLFNLEPLWRTDYPLTGKPAVDITENDKAYEIVAELPGLDEKNVEVKVANGGVTIMGSKHEEKEEKNKSYHLQERRFGSFERYFALPEGVDADKIEARFKNGVLTVTMPKKPEAQKVAKKIDVKAA